MLIQKLIWGKFGAGPLLDKCVVLCLRLPEALGFQEKK